MKVVWAYADWTGKGEHDLAKSTFQQFMLVCSLTSWAKFAPNFERVLYADTSVRKWLRDRNLERLWDVIETVDFSKMLPRKYGVEFFAYPKMWAFTQQTEPFFICDTDAVLMQPLHNWFDPEIYWAWLYDHSIKQDLTSRGLEEFFRFSSSISSPGLRTFCNFTKCANGGMIFFPDPKIAQILGHTMMSISKDIEWKETDLNWVLYEEALIPSILEAMGHKMVDEPKGVRLEFCEMGNVEDYPDLTKQCAEILQISEEDILKQIGLGTETVV